jgi:hypothetical protein
LRDARLQPLAVCEAYNMDWRRCLVGSGYTPHNGAAEEERSRGKTRECQREKVESARERRERKEEKERKKESKE